MVGSHTHAGMSRTPERDTSIPRDSKAACRFKKKIARELMLNTLSPNLVAGIETAETVLHVVGDWNLHAHQFHAVVEEVCAALAVRSPRTRLGTHVIGAWKRRDSAATFFQEGVVKVERGLDGGLPATLEATFEHYKKQIARQLMLNVLGPRLVAGIKLGQTVLHVVGNWNLEVEDFNAVVSAGAKSTSGKLGEDLPKVLENRELLSGRALQVCLEPHPTRCKPLRKDLQ